MSPSAAARLVKQVGRSKICAADPMSDFQPRHICILRPEIRRQSKRNVYHRIGYAFRLT